MFCPLSRFPFSLTLRELAQSALYFDKEQLAALSALCLKKPSYAFEDKTRAVFTLAEGAENARFVSWCFSAFTFTSSNFSLL